MSKVTRPTPTDRTRSFAPDSPAEALPPDEMEALIRRGLEHEAHAPGRECPPRLAVTVEPILPEGDGRREFDSDESWW